MEQSEKSFKLNIADHFDGRPLTIDPSETTDSIPIYHCYLEGTAISQLRQEPVGKWVQIWGDLPAPIVQRVGEAIADYIG